MENDSIEAKGELDVNRFYKKLSSLQNSLNELEKEAEQTDLLETVTTEGVFLWKKEKLNPEKLEKVSSIQVRQSELNSQFFEIQLQAMMLSIGSIEVAKKVHENLSELIDRNAKDSVKTKELIGRVATFSKRYADMVEDIKKHLEEYTNTKISETKESVSALHKDFVHKDNLKALMSNYADNAVCNSIEKKLEHYVHEDDLKNQLENTSVSLRCDIKDITEKVDSLKKSFPDKIDAIEKSLEENKKKLEHYVHEDDLKNQLENTSVSLRYDIKDITEKVDSLKESFSDKTDTIEKSLEENKNILEIERTELENLKTEIAVIQEWQKKICSWKFRFKRGIISIIFIFVAMFIIMMFMH